MSDEIKTEEKQECKCFCHSKAFKKFLTIALGTFVGVYCALSLFAALHRPPIMPMPGAFGMRGCPMQMMHHKHHFDKAYGPHFDKKFAPDGPRAPFEKTKPEADD